MIMHKTPCIDSGQLIHYRAVYRQCPCFFMSMLAVINPYFPGIAALPFLTKPQQLIEQAACPVLEKTD